MSLVERALKKLQESRATAPDAPAAAPHVAPPQPRPTVPLTPGPAAPVEHRQPVFEPRPRAEPPKRVVHIDRNALRDMQLMPPVAFERQIASQYQHVKRPLVASALGKSGTRVPNGHLIMLASALPGEG